MSEFDLDDLRAELEEFATPQRQTGRSPREERIIAGFEEIQAFYEKHKRPPQHGEDRDIFERLYAVRLDRLKALEECRTLLEPLDKHGLLSGAGADEAAADDDVDVDELAAELAKAGLGGGELSDLRHVRPSAEKRAAEEVANREKCEDFDRFKPIFKQVQKELDEGIRTTRPFVKDAGFQKADIVEGELFIVGGQIAYVAEVGETFKAPNGEFDARLRVIYSNGTESNLLRRSLQRALYQPENAGRRITEPSAGPLFADAAEDGDQASGTIYVLRSMSDHPVVAANRNVLHKIGVTGGSVERRIANARDHATFLLADVEVVATYELFNINRTKLENLIHRIFEPARLDVEIKDRFGRPVTPREWFLVPLSAIDDAVEKIKDGTITDYRYDPGSAKLLK
jgi:hypothetical protein